MKIRDKIFYLFLIVWFVSFFVTKPINLINLIVLGIFIKLISEKQKKNTYSKWSLIVALGIVSCNLIIGLGIIFGIVKL